MNEKKEVFLNKFVSLINNDGVRLLSPAFLRAAMEVGITQGEAKILFPLEEVSVVEFYFLKKIEQFENFDCDFKDSSLSDKVKKCLEVCFELLTSEKKFLLILVKYFLCSNKLLGIKYVYRVCDSIWKKCGICDLNFTFYTRRASLFILFLSCLFVFLKSDSKKLFKTISCGVGVFAKIGRVKSSFKRKVSNLFF